MLKEIDCRGLACPQPVINTKKALEEIEEGTVITVVDNLAAKENVTLFAQNAGCEVKVAEKEGSYILTINKRKAFSEKIKQLKTSETLYFITSNQLGEGSPELGQILIKSFLFTLTEQQLAPQTLIFLNSGVYLTTAGSPVLEELQVLSDKGTEILSCGTCLDYYKIKEKLLVGRISNMYEINDYLTKTGKVITI
jgi:tRNA 2-thiouridine synthesizing protein A